MYSSIVLVNQSSGYLVVDTLNAFCRIYDEVTVICGAILEGCRPLNPGVKVDMVCKYDKRSSFRRVVSWGVCSIQVFFKLLFKYRRSYVLYYTNPPIACFSAIFLKNRFSIVEYDIYPDVLKTVGIEPFHLIPRIWTLINKRVFSKAENIYVLSEGMKDSLARYGFAEKIKVVPLWSDADGFQMIPKESNIFIKKNRLDDKFIVLYSGNIGYTHSVEKLIDVADLLVGAEDILFLIIGDGGKKKDLKREVDEKHLGNVMFLPYQEMDIFPSVLSSADLGVVTLDENVANASVPSKTFDLMAAGVPILAIAPVDSEMCRLIDKYRNGRSIKKESVRDMADFILRLRNDLNLRKTLSGNSLRASGDFTFRNAELFVERKRNILFLTMADFPSIEERGIYTDLMRRFRDEKMDVYVVCPRERRHHIPSGVSEKDGINILGVKTLNVQKTNVIEKGLGQILIEIQYKRAIKKYFGDVRFDIVLYSTPPVTLVNAIKYVKRKTPDTMSYLLLKDIFPQNAIDIGMLSKTGLRGLMYSFFRRKEKQLYSVSDWIGCMSPANVRYVIDHNPDVNPAKVEEAPNSFEVYPDLPPDSKDLELLEKYGLPVGKTIFIYGGNLGKPQGISFLIKCLEANRDREDCHFAVVGSGYEFPKIKAWHDSVGMKNFTLIPALPRDEYDRLTMSCDVGIIFLDYRFTIPNYPGRLLNYLIMKKPVIACTDPNCDIGTIAETNGYGYWCPSNSVGAFTITVDKMLRSDIRKMGKEGYKFFIGHYTTEHTFEAIMKHLR